MTDIRKHGFESDAQWREHLEEIEEASLAGSSDEERRARAVQRDLIDLRAEVDELRARVHAHVHVRPRREGRRWRVLGAGLLLLLLAAAAR